MSERLPERLETAHSTGLEHALDLANRGWYVVPYLDRDDHKQLPGWPEKATTDREQLEAWFSPGQPYEGAYVGVLPAKSGLTCIDFDRHEGRADGFATAKALELPDHAVVEGTSKSGLGRHIWFRGTATSRAIYDGIDRKSVGGLVRVPYLLPDVEDVYEPLPDVYRVNNSSNTERLFDGTCEEWVKQHGGAERSSAVEQALKSIPNPFVGNGHGLRVTTRLVRLAGEGEGGVPEALSEAGDRWMAAKHQTGNPAAEWTRMVASAIKAFGGESKRSPTTTGPERFFTKQGRLLPKTLADEISYDLALGPDHCVWIYQDGVWRSKDDEIERRMVRTLRNRYSASQRATVYSSVKHGQDLLEIPDEPDPRWINFQNGMYDWRSGVLQKHAPEFRSIVQLPITWDAAATCPNFDAWLQQVVPMDAIPLIWETLGYLVMAGNPFHHAFLLFGPGGNGKGTFLRVVERLLGPRNTSHLTLRDIAEGKFEVAELHGRIANLCGDIDAKYLDDAARFKSVTGQDRVTAQRKYGQPFDFTPFAVPIFSANKLWRSGDTSDGYFRRWVILPFPNHVIGHGSFNEQMLLDESAGILAKACRALQTLMGRGHFELPTSVETVTRQFKIESDPIRCWLSDDEHLEVDAENDKQRSTKGALYERYVFWCALNGLAAKSKPELLKSLYALGFGTKTVNGTRYVTGLAIAPLVVGN